MKNRLLLLPPAILACSAFGPLLAQSPAPLATPDSAVPAGANAEPVVPVERARDAGVFTIYVENDYFTGTDKDYTSGTKLSWLSGDLTEWGQTGWRSGFLAALPFVNRPGTQKNFGFSLGQQIYNPQDQLANPPDPTDRPYAGWSYVELSFISKDESRADIISIQLGIVGPSSGAEKVQTEVHELIDDDIPQGWDYQLEDEPGLNLIYERRYRMAARAVGESLGFDFIPHGGVSLGNVQTHANLGGTARLGFNLPSDFGVGVARGASVGASPIDDLDPRVAPDRDLSIFLFAGADGRAVAQNIFLDGNTWKDSASVDKEHFVADVFVGVGLIAGRWQLTATVVHRTKEFETQPDPWSRFGSVSLSVAF
ncbi:MAG: lipid A deacylase LpxR family protein [Burkholderiales bacterium]|nr:lipid A deacylase LpxR family protein [Opitutaceae bacterium]